MNEIDAAMLAYLERHEKASAVELSALTGITVSSVRYHLFQLMGVGKIRREKVGNHRVWFSLSRRGTESILESEGVKAVSMSQPS